MREREREREEAAAVVVVEKKKISLVFLLARVPFIFSATPCSYAPCAQSA